VGEVEGEDALEGVVLDEVRVIGAGLAQEVEHFVVLRDF
jgi:hypothetical protein